MTQKKRFYSKDIFKEIKENKKIKNTVELSNDEFLYIYNGLKMLLDWTKSKKENDEIFSFVPKKERVKKIKKLVEFFGY